MASISGLGNFFGYFHRTPEPQHNRANRLSGYTEVVKNNIDFLEKNLGKAAGSRTAMNGRSLVRVQVAADGLITAIPHEHSLESNLVFEVNLLGLVTAIKFEEGGIKNYREIKTALQQTVLAFNEGKVSGDESIMLRHHLPEGEQEAVNRLIAEGPEIERGAIKYQTIIQLEPGQISAINNPADQHRDQFSSYSFHTIDNKARIGYSWVGFKFVPAGIKNEVEQDNELFRAYGQVDYQQLPEAFKVIIKVAEDRKAQGMPTRFKILIKKLALTMPGQDKKDDGYYFDADPSGAMIAFYFDTAAERKTFLQELSDTAEWQKLNEGRSHESRREKTQAFVNNKGITIRSLCLNEGAGHAGDGIEGDWREHFAAVNKRTSY